MPWSSWRRQPQEARDVGAQTKLPPWSNCLAVSSTLRNMPRMSCSSLPLTFFERPAEVLGVLAHLKAGTSTPPAFAAPARYERHASTGSTLGCLKRGGRSRSLTTFAAVGQIFSALASRGAAFSQRRKRDVAGSCHHAAAVLRHAMLRVWTFVHALRPGKRLCRCRSASVVDVLEHPVIDAVGVFHPALRVGAGQYLAAKLRNLLNGVDRNVAGAAPQRFCLRSCRRCLEIISSTSTPGQSWWFLGAASEPPNDRPFYPSARRSTCRGCACTGRTCSQPRGRRRPGHLRNVGVRADVTTQLGHKRLTEVHDLKLLDLPFDRSGAALPPPMGSVVRAFLKICSKPKNFPACPA